MRRRTGWLIVGSVALLAIGVAAAGMIVLVLGWRGGAHLGGPKYVELQVGGDLEEWRSTDMSLFGKEPPLLSDLVRTVDAARTDDDVSALVVKVRPFPGAGWGRIQDLRDALVRFQTSGKPSYCYLEGVGNKGYYLATGCSRILAAPTSLLDVTGLALSVSFFRGTLDKLGIEAQFEGIGRYKNAPNQFLETGFTAPHREQLDALLDDLHGQYVSALAKARHLSTDQVQRILDQGPYDGEGARAAGLVDELLYPSEIDTRLAGAGRATADDYSRTLSRFALGRPKIAIVHVEGEIVSGRSSESPFGGSAAGADSIARALRTARDDGSVKAIILRIDSPGGSGDASDAIWHEVRAARSVKPVIASMSDVAASGGYYVAMGADVIVAQPGTITGSIGVFGGKFTLKGLYDKLGMTKDELSRAQHATMSSDYDPWDASERATIRALLTRFYETFLEKAAEGRGVSKQAIDTVAQGRVWSGAAARGRGLVDSLGGLREAIDVAKKRAGIPPQESVALLVLPRPRGIVDTLLGRDTEDDMAALGARLPPTIRALLTFAWAQQQGGMIMARIPFQLDVR
jgi:protease-4